jgi:hypothetical protein
MISYRFKRRAFLSAVGGGVGLKILLRNMEAAAQTTKSPNRLLVTHWPVGIVAGSGDALWKPTSGSVTGSPGLQPFADAGLDADMTVIRTISTPVGQGGSHEGGTPALVTNVAPAGTRSGEAESDDAYSSGESIDQILLGGVASLKVPNAALNYMNVGCDTRTDFGEISTKCLSYSSMTQSVMAALGPMPATEHIPLMPNLSPLNAYNQLFANFVPMPYQDPNNVQAAAPTADATLTQLASRRSVLDFAAQELNMLRGMGPADTKSKLDNHYNAILQMENSLTATINGAYGGAGGSTGSGAGGTMGLGGMGGSGTGAGGRGGTTGTAGTGGRGGTTGTGGRGGTTGSAGTTGGAGTTGAGGTGGQVIGCKTKPTAPANVMGAVDPKAGLGNPYGTTGNQATSDDTTNMTNVSAAHYAVMKAAFMCDIIRCGTYLFAPGTNHTAFAGLYPNSSTIYMHHPTSHKIVTSDTTASTSLSGLRAEAQFLFNVQLWFFKQVATNMKDWKNSTDGYGNSLLDYTVVPYITEVQATGHERNSIPGMIIGGKALGYTHGIYKTGQQSIGGYWGTIAQAFGYAPSGPVGSPISGLWTKPA